MGFDPVLTRVLGRCPMRRWTKPAQTRPNYRSTSRGTAPPGTWLVELQAPEGASTSYGYVNADWARRWPSEEVWVARKVA